MTKAPFDEEYVRALEEKVRELQGERNQLKAKVDELLRELGSGR
jgi:Spy/CpxP family protein refolding chaperone